MNGRMVGAKREKSNAIVIKTDELKYLEALKAMRSVTMLTDIGPDVVLVVLVPMK